MPNRLRERANVETYDVPSRLPSQWYVYRRGTSKFDHACSATLVESCLLPEYTSEFGAACSFGMARVGEPPAIKLDARKWILALATCTVTFDVGIPMLTTLA